AAAELKARAIRLRDDERLQRSGGGRVSAAAASRSDTRSKWRVEDVLDDAGGQVDLNPERLNLHPFADLVPHDRRHRDGNGGPSPGEPRALRDSTEERDAIRGGDTASPQRIEDL